MSRFCRYLLRCVKVKALKFLWPRIKMKVFFHIPDMGILGGPNFSLEPIPHVPIFCILDQKLKRCYQIFNLQYLFPDYLIFYYFHLW